MMLPTNVPEGTPDWKTHKHSGWFNVHSSFVQCPGCLVLVSDAEVHAFAKRTGRSDDDVRPGTVLAQKLHAPWA